MTRTSGKLPATLIPGDGIGPEIVKSAVDILEALGSPFEWDIQQGGLAAIEASHDPLPQATLDSIRRTRLALKGPLTTPVGGGFRSINVRLREEFGLYANVRPVRSMVPGGQFDDIDIVLVREIWAVFMSPLSTTSRSGTIRTQSPFRPASTRARGRARSSNSHLITRLRTDARRLPSFTRPMSSRR